MFSLLQNTLTQTHTAVELNTKHMMAYKEMNTSF